MAEPLDDELLQKLYVWVDEIPLTRPKRNINRDFSDGVMLAEAVHHFLPRLVELHNYSAAHSVRQKMYNWQTLNQKVLKRLGCQLSPETIDHLVNAKPGVIENVLLVLQQKIAEYKSRPRDAKAIGDSDYDAPEESPRPQLAQHPAVAAVAPSARSTGSSAPALSQPPQFAPQTASGRSVGTVPPSVPAPVVSAPVKSAPVGGDAPGGRRVDADVLLEKEQTIQEYKETVQILELKVRKLEQLVRIKDSRIQTLTARVQALEAAQGIAGTSA